MGSFHMLLPEMHRTADGEGPARAGSEPVRALSVPRTTRTMRRQHYQCSVTPKEPTSLALRISPSKRSFEQDGAPFFYLSDTVWSAFTGPTEDEWERYLSYRRRQGFTALQISVLPILHDASQSALGYAPFARDAQGRWDFFTCSDSYFTRAATLVRMARAQGFVPALVPLWCNYVPNTWASLRDAGAIMPFGAMNGYLERVVQVFAPYDPLYIVSGDTDFEAPDPIRYYGTALRTIKRLSPTSLTTLHLAPRADLPQELVESPDLDFYMYQSGHHIEEAHRPYTLAERFASKHVIRPVVNGEPCYEGHGYGFQYGRFSASDVRRATWQSLLSGASAGVTYGAHGVWSWHRHGAAFTSAAFSQMPFPWEDALRLEGSWDAAFARRVFEQFDLFGLQARQDLLVVTPPAVRAAASTGAARIAVYVPYATEVVLDVDGAEYEWTIIDLVARRWEALPAGARGGRTVLSMHPENNDIVALGLRKGIQAAPWHTGEEWYRSGD